MSCLTELRSEDNRRETILDKYIDGFVTGNIENLIIKEEWFMLEELREKYAARLQELEAQDIEVLVRERVAEVEAEIRAEIVAKHNDEVLLARLKVQAVEEMIADQAAELDEEENIVEE